MRISKSKHPLVFLALLLAVLATVSAARAGSILDRLQPIPDADAFTGEVAKYNFNGVTVHTYASEEGFHDWSILFETDKELVLLEPQTMPDSARDFRRYIESIGKPLAAILVSYHGVGPESYPGVPIYASPAAIDFIKGGKAEKVMADFNKLFPEFDPKIIIPTKTLTADALSFAGLDFRFDFVNNAYPMPGVDVALPRQKIFYMHMLGGDTHSILNSVADIDVFVAYLQDIKSQDYEIFLCSHHMPETVADVDAKIEYLEKVKAIAGKAKTRDEFIAEVKKAAPNLKGEHYLEMTAGNLYK